MDAAGHLCFSLFNEGRSKLGASKGKLEILRQSTGEVMPVLMPDGVNKGVVIYLKRKGKIQYEDEM